MLVPLSLCFATQAEPLSLCCCSWRPAATWAGSSSGPSQPSPSWTQSSVRQEPHKLAACATWLLYCHSAASQGSGSPCAARWVSLSADVSGWVSLQIRLSSMPASCVLMLAPCCTWADWLCCLLDTFSPVTKGPRLLDVATTRDRLRLSWTDPVSCALVTHL